MSIVPEGTAPGATPVDEQATIVSHQTTTPPTDDSKWL